MKIAFIVYDDMTALDFIGVYDPIARLKSMGFYEDLSIDICAYQPMVKDYYGYLNMLPQKIGSSLKEYDIVVLPGGFGSRSLINNDKFINWIQDISENAFKVSVCTGSLILGAAGFLNNRVATTHPNAYEKLKPFCKEVKRDRIVEDGNIITARGVTAGIDLGLYLCEKLTDIQTKELIRIQMDYNTFK